MYRLTDVAYMKAFESDFIGNDPYTKWLTNVGGFTLKGKSTGLKLAPDVNQPR